MMYDEIKIYSHKGFLIFAFFSNNVAIKIFRSIDKKYHIFCEPEIKHDFWPFKLEI